MKYELSVPYQPLGAPSQAYRDGWDRLWGRPAEPLEAPALASSRGHRAGQEVGGKTQQFQGVGEQEAPPHAPAGTSRPVGPGEPRAPAGTTRGPPPGITPGSAAAAGARLGDQPQEKGLIADG